MNSDQKIFRMEGDPTTDLGLLEFIEINDFDANEISQLEALPINGMMRFGGGAFAETSVERVA